MASRDVILKVHHNDAIYRLRIASADYAMVLEAFQRIPVNLTTCTVLVELAKSELVLLTEETWSSTVSEACARSDRVLVKLHAQPRPVSAGSENMDHAVIDDCDRGAMLDLVAADLETDTRENQPELASAGIGREDNLANSVSDRDHRAMLEVFAQELGIEAPEEMPLWELEAATDFTQETQREELERIELERCDNLPEVPSERDCADQIHRATLEAIAAELGIDSPQNMSSAELEAATRAAQQHEFQHMQMHKQALQMHPDPPQNMSSADQDTATQVAQRHRIQHLQMHRQALREAANRSCHAQNECAPLSQLRRHREQLRAVVRDHHEHMRAIARETREHAMSRCMNQLSRNVATMRTFSSTDGGAYPFPSRNSENGDLPTLRGFTHCGPLQRCGERLRLVNATITGPFCLVDSDVELVDSTITGPVTLRGRTQLILVRGRIIGPVSIHDPARFMNRDGAVIGPTNRCR